MHLAASESALGKPFLHLRDAIAADKDLARALLQDIGVDLVLNPFRNIKVWLATVAFLGFGPTVTPG